MSDYKSVAMAHQHRPDNGNDLITLQNLVSGLNETLGVKTNYITLYYAARFKRIPAIFCAGRWFVRRGDLQSVADFIREDAATHSKIAA